MKIHSFWIFDIEICISRGHNMFFRLADELGKKSAVNFSARFEK